jgi:cytoskeletal protein CcmA (bactofilin family)
MFLKRLVVTLHRDDSGAAIVSAIGVMAVGLLLSSLIMASVVSGVGFTSATKAGVQSQSSAEAGVSVALASLHAGTCDETNGEFSSAEGETPIYSATVYRQDAIGNWTPGCPVSGTPAVKVVANGTASALGVAGQVGNDESKVEAVFSTAPVTNEILATGPAVYAYSSQGFSGSGTLVSADGSNSNVMVKQGDVSCSGGAGMAADLVVNNGNLALSGSCNVTGSVWVSGTLTMSGGVRVNGNVYAGAVSIPNGKVGGGIWSNSTATIGSSTVGGSVTAKGNVSLSSTTVGGSVWSQGKLSTTGSSKITGNAIATGNIELLASDTISGSAWAGGQISTTWGGLINGNATANTITMGGGDIKGMSWGRVSITHNGWYTVSGSVTAKQLNLNGGPSPRYLGTTTVIPSGVGDGPLTPESTAATPQPLIPNWVDFTYKPADWAGFTVVTLPSTPCDYGSFQAAVTSLGGTKGVIDARACSASTLAITGWQTLTITNDLAIFGKSFSLSGGGHIASAQSHKLWFITTDDTDNDLPTCITNDFKIDGGFVIDATLDTMVYTPCKATISSGIKWRGQVFAGKVVVDGGAKITFVPVGLPNVDLSTGFSSVSDETTTDWTMTSSRNVAP